MPLECSGNLPERERKVPAEKHKLCARFEQFAYFMCRQVVISPSNIGEARKGIIWHGLCFHARLPEAIPEDPFRYEKNRSGY
jgi:hypothetical protein